MKIAHSLSIILLILMNWLPAFGHIHWIMPSQKNLSQNCKIKICSGHQFPDSNFAIDKELISEINIYTDSGQKKIKKIDSFENHRFFTTKLKSLNTLIMEVLLKKPLNNKTLFYMRYFHIGNNDNEQKYISNRGLEIVPLKNISKIRKGNKVPFKILYNSNPFSGTITVQTKDDIKYWKTNKNGISNIKINNIPGYYLFSTKYKGVGCSLVLYIP